MKRAVICSLVVLLVVSAGGFVLSRDDGDARSPDGPPPGGQQSARQSGRPSTAPGDAPAARAAVAARPRGREMPPQYQIVLERSMFANRPPPQAGGGGKARPHPPEASLVLRGVTVQSGDVTALVEDVAAGTVHRLHAGDSIGRGRVARVGLDGVEYLAEGRSTQVSIGRDLSGGAAAAVAPASAVASKADPAADPRERKQRRRDREREGDATAASPVSP